MKLMKRSGVMAKKLGMTRVYLESGQSCPVTVLDLQGASVISAKTSPCGTYYDLQVGSGTPKHVKKPMEGFFSKNGVAPKTVVRTFRVTDKGAESGVFLPGASADGVENSQASQEDGAQAASWLPGQVFRADYFSQGAYVDITGVTIGRGFAGSMKRHNFSGLRASHGVSVSHRSHGSTGNRKDPGRVFKGKKMAGHMGCKQVTVQNLKVMEVDAERGLIVVKGNIPGFESGWVMIRDAVKRGAPRIKI